MHPRYLKTNPINTVIAVLFFIVLVATAAIALTSNAPVTEIVVAVTALTGVFALYVESRRGKNIAMGEFVLNLNSEFDNNTDRAQIHKRIISNDRLNQADKPALVAYLTFFEIIYRLILSHVIRIDVVDDLFRSRFFRAVHNIDVQDLELLPDADGYRNIYELEQLWIDYLKSRGIELQRGKRRLPSSALRRAREQVHFTLSELQPEAASIAHKIITTSGASSPEEHFVINDFETIQRQMMRGITVVANRRPFPGPIGLLHVYFPTAEENLGRYVADDGEEVHQDLVAHMDIAAVLPEHRGYGLLSLLLIEAEFLIRQLDSKRQLLMATVHPNNSAALRSFEFAGYSVVANIEIHDSLPRLLVGKRT